MKKRVVLYSFIFIVLQLLKGIFLLEYKGDYGISRIEILLEDEAFVGDKQVKQEVYETYYPIRTSYKKDVHVEAYPEGVTIIATDFNAKDLEPIHMQEGAFFGKEAALEGRNVAIISDTIALKLFGSSKVVGSKVHIENTVYQIIGVYKRYRNLKDYKLDCGRERIYIPLQSELSKQWQVNEITIDGTFLEALPDEEALEGMGINSHMASISDQSMWYRELRSLAKLPLIVFTIMFAYRFVKYVPYLMRRDENFRKKLFKIGVCLIFLTFLFFISRKDFYVQAQALPLDNIFDIGFYWQALISEWARHNQFIGNPASSFERALYQLKQMIHLFNAIQIIVSIRLLKNNLTMLIHKG